MIICLYHGSSINSVNLEQTSNITNYIDQFTDDIVISAYYSKKAVQNLKANHNILIDYYLDVIKDNYHQDQIFILITNIMNGIEYKKILQNIKEIDIDSKVKLTKNLMHPQYINKFVNCLENTNEYTVYIGHGNRKDHDCYNQLNNLLNAKNIKVITLYDDVNNVINNLEHKCITLKPLMITKAYHVTNDIENSMLDLLKDTNVQIIMDNKPLCFNQKLLLLLKQNILEITKK